MCHRRRQEIGTCPQVAHQFPVNLYLSRLLGQIRARMDASPLSGRRAAAILAVAAVAVLACNRCALAAGGQIRLVLQITVDQLRADLALRSRDHWSKDGFRRLYEHGAVFSDAHHGHAITETIVGHATLATGADPAVHGMVGNVWYDRVATSLHYNVEDPRFEVTGNDGAAAATSGGLQKKGRGRSPDAMLAPTIADSIALAGKGQAKVFAVSLKDRGAVPMAGRAGKALWWSDATGEFISSTYYYPEHRLPAWAKAWNDAREVDRIDGRSWSLLLDRKSYRFGDRDDMPWEIPPTGMGRTFPHRFDRARLGNAFYEAVESSPFGDDLMLDFVRELMRAEGLGRDEVVDYLSVSLTSNDYIGHHFGPDSLEVEDEILRLDHVIAQLLAAADKLAGDGHTLFVLSSDHGVAGIPDALTAAGQDAGTVVLSQIEASDAVARLTRRFGGDFIRCQWPPYVYLDTEKLGRRGIDPETAARALASEIEKTPGVAAAFTRGQIESGALPDTDAARAVRRSFHPLRSGDIHVLARPGWQLAFEGVVVTQYATSHGTPWDYDTFVPLIFAGAGVPHTTVGRRVETIDVAPTIAAIVGVDPPTRSTGHVLTEAMR